MPAYPWLQENALGTSDIQAKMRALKAMGHPYSDEEINNAPAELEGKTEMDAMIAYLQSLGRSMKAQ